MKTISINRAATELGRSRHKVRQYVDTGVLPAVVFPDGELRIKIDVWEEFLRSFPAAYQKPEKPAKSLKPANLKSDD